MSDKKAYARVPRYSYPAPSFAGQALITIERNGVRVKVIMTGNGESLEYPSPGVTSQHLRGCRSRKGSNETNPTPAAVGFIKLPVVPTTGTGYCR